jgi:cobalt-zinc-cadmium efflux system protein
MSDQDHKHLDLPASPDVGHDGNGHHHHRDRGHHGHSHGGGVGDEQRIGLAFIIVFLFMLVEVAGGIMSGSLALLADAGHMVSDAGALGMSWAALRLGKRAADTERTYGYRRAEVLVAFVNGCTLFVIAGWVVLEAIRRFAAPVKVLAAQCLLSPSRDSWRISWLFWFSLAATAKI